MKPRKILVVMSMPLTIACSATPANTVPIADAPLQDRMIEVNGSAVHVVSSGLAQRKPGQPVVIFESGGSIPLSTWDPILPAVARSAPVLAYDRPGTGGSPWDSLPPTPERMGFTLQAILAKLGAAPPYVLVGHSWGSALARFFAGRYPEQIAALLYLDPTDITQTPADEIALFIAIGAGQSERDAFYRVMEQAMMDAPPAIRAEATVVTDLMQRDLMARGLGPAPDVPTSVILAGRLPRFPQGRLPFDTEAYARAMHDGRRTRLTTWVRGGGSFIEAANSGHFVHADEPALVIEEIRRLVQQTR